MNIRKEIIEVCRRAYEKGFVAAYDGNMSARVSKNSILITPSRKCKGDLCQRDLIEIDTTGKMVLGEGKPSTELKLHLEIYKQRKEINSVCHCHPVFASAFATANVEINVKVLPEAYLTFEEIPVCRYSAPSTEELAESIKPFIKKSNALLLANHGAVTIGKTVMEAYYYMEKLEHTAKTLYLSRALGGAKELDEDELIKLKTLAESVYGIKTN